MDRRGSDEARREERPRIRSRSGIALARPRSVRSSSLSAVSRLCAREPRRWHEVGGGNSASRGLRRLVIGASHWQGSPIGRPSKLGRGVVGHAAPRGGSRFRMARGMRQIHMDPLVCRYSELGMKPNSTPVHLWISEHKSAIPSKYGGLLCQYSG